MISDSLLFTLALLDTACILCLLIYFWVLPKLMAHGFLTFLLLIHAHWILVLVNLPMTLWLAYEHFTVPTGNTGVYDPTEIHNRGQLKKHMRDCMIYLGYYLIFFVVYLYCLIISLLQGNPIKRDEDLADMHDY
ncbi:Protein cornichon [Gryllus bimaculatus]|nr:Protein cornichon [Gryllus bimaculatus]